MSQNGDLWIFAYGSLMWRPDFVFVERHKARLSGYHRSLCIFSHHYRGTTETPGLVLGLDRGGSCLGVAFKVDSNHREATLDAVRARELVTGVYLEVTVNVTLPDGAQVRATTYVADRAHLQYAGKLHRQTVLACVARAAGVTGPNLDYVRNTDLHLRNIGIVDRNLAWIVQAIDGLPEPEGATIKPPRRSIKTA